LSRIIAINQILNINSNDLSFFGDTITPQILEPNNPICINTEDETEYEKNKGQWEKSYKINNVGGYTSLKLLLQVVPRNNIACVLVEKKHEHPVVLFLPHENRHIILTTNKFKNNKYLRSIIKTDATPFSEDYQKNSNYKWLYFINISQEEIMKKLSKIIGAVNPKELVKISNNINEELQTDFYMIGSETEFADYCFNVYLNLYQDSGYLTFSSNEKAKAEVYYDNIKKVYEPLNKEIPLLIGKMFEEFTKSKILNENINVVDLLSGMNLLKLIEFIIDNVLKEKKKIMGLVSRSLDDSLMKRVLKIRLISGVKKNIFDNIFNIALVESDFYRIIKEKRSSEIFDSKDLKAFKEKIVVQYGIDPAAIANKYKLRHAKTKTDSLDHGILSACLFFYVFEYYKKIYENKAKNEKLPVFLKFATGAEFNLNDYDKLIKYQTIISEVGFAIFVHNLYPEYLHQSLNPKKQTAYQIGLDRYPFAYIAILADSLQPWDRKRSYNPATDDLPYSTFSNAFDVIIKHGKIKILEKSPNMDLRLRFDTLKDSIDEYLKNAKSLIELNLSEWS